MPTGRIPSLGNPACFISKARKSFGRFFQGLEYRRRMLSNLWKSPIAGFQSLEKCSHHAWHKFTLLTYRGVLSESACGRQAPCSRCTLRPILLEGRGRVEYGADVLGEGLSGKWFLQYVQPFRQMALRFHDVRGIAGHKEDADTGPEFLNVFRQLLAAHIRHDHIGQEQVNRFRVLIA